MGNKIRPDSFRLGIIGQWSARWFADKNFGKQLEEDELIRETIEKAIHQAGIVKIEIERTNNTFRIYIKAARPGLIIGRGGQGVEALTKKIESELKKLIRKRNPSAGSGQENIAISLNIEELKRSEMASANIAQNIAWDLEKRMPTRRTMKRYLELVMQNKDIQGCKVKLSGRLDGAEISRREWLAKGKLPLSTLRANIDYGEATAFTTYGTVGIKVWLYKGEIFNKNVNS
ncbi:MAG: 30S ribosomal protein S3 [Patescibacteria group bacterium]